MKKSDKETLKGVLAATIIATAGYCVTRTAVNAILERYSDRVLEAQSKEAAEQPDNEDK